MKWGLWSTTAGSNSATPPDGWPEGQAPSTVNDCAREMMAQIRTGLNDIQFIDLGVTPTQTGNVTFTLAGNQMQWYPYGTRVKANVGGTNAYGTVISSTFTTNTGITLRFDTGQGPLTASLSAVSTGFPSPNGAIPENVFRRRNAMINSCMDIWQRGNSFSATGGAVAVYTSDRWQFNASMTAAAAVTISRFERSANSSFVPTVAQSGFLITSAWGMSVNVAMATLNAGSYAYLAQKIEGYNWRHLAQKPTTLSFWINSRQTGTYCVALQNGAANQSVVQSYQISAIATWEKKTITFPKSPSSGTWDYSGGIGCSVIFTMMAGSTFQGGAGNWTATSIYATSSQTNFMASAGNVVMITGIQFEEGTKDTPLEPVDIQVDLIDCQRYCQTLFGSGVQIPGPTYTTNAAQFMVNFNAPMRAAPAATFPGLGNVAAFIYPGPAATAISALSLLSSDANRAILNAVVAGAPGFGAGTIYFGLSSGTQIVFNSELP